MSHGRRRRHLVLGCLATAAVLAAGCGSPTTAGNRAPAKKATTTQAADVPPAGSGESPKPLSANAIKTLALSTEDIDDIVGLPLDERSELASPTTASGDYDHPNCALAMGITKDALGDGEFTAYRAISNRGTKGESSIGSLTQVVATFETAAKASELFHNAYGSLASCNGSTLSPKSDKVTWKILAPGPFTGDVATFSSLQRTDDTHNLGWRCSNNVRVKNNVIIEARFCGWANGAPAIAAVADQISARIPPPDKAAPRAPSNLLGPEKVKTVLLSIPQISNILGANLGFSDTAFYPADPRDFGAHSNCSPLLGPDAHSFGADVDYTAFREVDLRENKDSSQHTVDQQVATYLDADTASQTFHAALANLAGCAGVRVPAGSASDEQFQLELPTVDGDIARWSLTDLKKGQPSTWRCAFVFRTQSNVVFTAKVCQYGNPVDVANQVADRMAAALPT